MFSSLKKYLLRNVIINKSNLLNLCKCVNFRKPTHPAVKNTGGKKRSRSSLTVPDQTRTNSNKRSRQSDPSFNRNLRVRQQRISSEESLCDGESSDDLKRRLALKKKRIQVNAEENSGNTSSISTMATPIETSGDETSRGTLEAFIPPLKNFDGVNNPFSNLTTHFGYSNSSVLSVRPLKKRLSEKDIWITKSGEVKRRKFVRKWKRAQSDIAHSLFHSDPALNFSTQRSEGKFPLPFYDPKDSVLSYFGMEERVSRGEKYIVHARRILPKGSAQFLIEWETDKIT